MGLYQYDSTEDKLNLVAGSTNFSDAPVGAIYPFGGTVIPTSFLLCDGSAVSRTDYEDLFNVIGTAFGTGDGSTTFNLPDLRESVPKGAGETGQTVGAHVKSGGLAVGEFLDDRLQAHTHSNRTGATEAGQVAWTMFATNHLESATEQTNNGVQGRFGNTTEVKSVGVNYIIKAKQIGMPTDFASAVGDIVVDKNTYSTSETVVGKWVDGKPIYRKCITINEALTLTPTTSTGSWNSLIAKSTYGLTDILSIIDSKLYRRDHRGIINGLTVGPGPSSYIQYILCGNTTWTISANSTLILEYTKTTD